MATYSLRADGSEYDTVEAENIDAALERAAEEYDRTIYDLTNGTVYVTIYAVEQIDGESGHTKIACDPGQPKCSAEEHGWQRTPRRARLQTTRRPWGAGHPAETGSFRVAT